MTAQTRLALSDVLEHLPEEFRSNSAPQPGFAELVGVARGAVPLGRFNRFWTLGTLHGKIAAAYTF